jgi:hypothetical protein
MYEMNPGHRPQPPAEASGHGPQPGTPSSASLDRLFETANELMSRHSEREWYGNSGARVTGAQVAQNLDDALLLLKNRGWDKTDLDNDVDVPDWNPAWELLDVAQVAWQIVRDNLTGPITLKRAILETGTRDVFVVTDRCLRAILSAAQHHTCTSIDAWAERPEVTPDMVENLLLITAEYARRHNPGGFNLSLAAATQHCGITAH